jgi:hypothetical protein
MVVRIHLEATIEVYLGEEFDPRKVMAMKGLHVTAVAFM